MNNISLITIFLALTLSSCSDDIPQQEIQIRISNHLQENLISPSLTSHVGKDRCSNALCDLHKYSDVLAGDESEIIVFKYFNTSCIGVESENYSTTPTDCYLFNYLNSGQYILHIFDDYNQNYIEQIE